MTYAELRDTINTSCGMLWILHVIILVIKDINYYYYYFFFIYFFIIIIIIIKNTLGSKDPRVQI